MKKFKKNVKGFLFKYGALLASCAFAFVTISANSSCAFPFYEAEEPQEIGRFKKFNG